MLLITNLIHKFQSNIDEKELESIVKWENEPTTKINKIQKKKVMHILMGKNKIIFSSK